MARIILDANKGKEVSTSYTLNQGDLVSLSGFDLTDAKLFINELNQLVIVLIDGTQFLLSNFADLLSAFPDDIFMMSADGSEMTYAEVIAKFLDSGAEVEPALGPDTTVVTESTTDALSGGSSAQVGDFSTTSTTSFTTSLNFAPSVTPTTQTTGGSNGTVLVDNPISATIAPSNNSGNSTVVEDTSAGLGISLPTDIDSDDASLVITITNLPGAEAGVVQLSGVNVVVGQIIAPSDLASLVFVPAADYNGTTSFSYAVSDGVNVTSSTQVIEVTYVEDTPVVSGPSSITINEDAPITDLNLAIPTDADTAYGDVLVNRITTSIASINGVISLDGQAISDNQEFTSEELARLKFTPTPDFNGVITIDYTSTDSSNNTVSNTHTINVTSVSDIPSVGDSSSTQDEDTVNVTLGIPEPTDADGDVLISIVGTLPANGTLNFANGSPVLEGVLFAASELPGLTFTPTPDFYGTVTITYEVSDGVTPDVTATHTVTVNNINDLPVVTDSTFTQNEDTTDVTLNIPVVTDADGDALIARVDTLPTEGVLKFANGNLVVAGQDFDVTELQGLTFTPNADYFGDVTINYVVSDNIGPDVAGSYTITVTGVEDAPVTTDSSSSQDEDTSAVLGIPTPTDADGDLMTATIATLPTEGTLNFANGTAVIAGVAFSSTELAGITFTPNANYFGTVAIDYTVTDGNNAPISATHTVTVNSVNDVPLVTDSSSTQDEDSSNVALNIPAPTDVENDVLQFDLLPQHGVVKLANGTTVVEGVSYDIAEITGLTFTPDANFFGTVEINYTVTDGIDSAAGKHTVTVTGVEDAPVVTNSSSVQDENSVSFTLGIPNPTDADGDLMTATVTTLPTEGVLKFANGTNVQAGVAFSSTELAGLTFTPNDNYNGSVNINYTVTDGKNAPVAGTHTATVTNINDLPVVTDSSSNQNEDTTNVTLGINTPTDADGDLMTATIATLPTDGVLKFANGATVQAGVAFSSTELAGLTFTPNANYNGTVNINYTVTDNIGADVAGTHTIVVNPVNDLPVITNSGSTQNEDSANITLGISTPTDVDGDTLIATIATLPTEGVLKFANGALVQAGLNFNANELSGITFTPNANYNGSVNINYTVTDNNSAPIAGTHTVTVTAVNDAPIVTNSSSAQNEDSSNVTLGINTPVDVDGDTMTATIATLPTQGTLRFANGAEVQAGVSFLSNELSGITFTPNANYNGTVNISYTVTDGNSSPVLGVHTVTVNSVNDIPVVTNSSSSQDEDSSAVVLGINTPTDTDGDLLTAVFATLPTEGVLRFASGAVVQAGINFNANELSNITFTPNANYNGTIALNYTVTDGKSAPVAGTHTVTVNSINDAPTVVDSSSSQDEDTTNVTLGINTPVDVDGDLMTATIATLPTQGTLRFANGDSVQAGVAFSSTELAGITFTPNADYFGTVNINYTVTDGMATSSGTHTVTVNNVAEPILLRYDNLGLTGGIVADLEDNTVVRSNGQVDHLDGNHRGIIATNYNDVITAKNGIDNYIDARYGDDLIYSGDSADTINGGAFDSDTVSYANSDAGVNVNLFNGTASGGYAEGDQLSEIENLTGSDYNDSLLGNSRDNILDGGAGSDVLYAGNGEDTIIYDGADSAISGGNGMDTLIINDYNSSTSNNIDLSKVAGGNLAVTSIETIDMTNATYNETVHINISELLSTAENREIFIKGNLITDLNGTIADDNVRIHDKTGSEIFDARDGAQIVDGTRYTVYDFGYEGKLYVETGLDILDSSGDPLVS